MKALFDSQITELPYVADESLGFSFLLSYIRCLVQQASLVALEYSCRYLDYADAPEIPSIANRLLAANDGDYVAALDNLIPMIRRDWPSCARGWFEKSEQAGPCSNGVLRWVSLRNNRPGHGVFDARTVRENIDWIHELAINLTHVLSDLLPRRGQQHLSGQLDLASPLGSVAIHSLRVIDGHPVLIRTIKRRGSAWRVTYQILDVSDSEEGYYDIDESHPLISACDGGARGYVSISRPVGTSRWTADVFLPQRQTSVFEGRDSELKALGDWFNDSDSRACLVYGEGGIGKTTLILEFLNEIIEAPPRGDAWRPEVICYFSAKQTRWGPDGLEYIASVAPVVADAVRALASLLINPGRDWYDEDPQKTVMRAAQVFAEAGVPRGKILLVLDNTETLARTSGEEAELSHILKCITKHLARVLMTSRRREKVEALPIQIAPLDDATGLALLRRLGKEYSAEALEAGAERVLRQLVTELSGKPLLLDVLARYAGQGRSIQEAKMLVLRNTRDDLGEFLFEDAWQRIDDNMRGVFLTLGQLGGCVDGHIVSWTCGEVGIPYPTWLEAFEETRFGSLNDYGTHFDVQLEAPMRGFLARKFRDISPDMQRKVGRWAAVVRERYMQYQRGMRADVKDRVAAAFRSPEARTAKIHADRGEVEEAIEWYEEAVRKDPANAALWDRYAWYLAVRVQNYQRADACAKRACELDPRDADACFTAGMIASRLCDVDRADALLDLARALGKEGHLTALQKARARVAIVEKTGIHSREHVQLVEGARKFLDEACDVPGGLVNWRTKKHLLEREWVADRLDRVVRRFLGKS